MWICFTWVRLLWLPWIYTEKIDVTFVLGDWLGDWLTGPFLPAAARSSIVNLKDWFSPAGMEHWVDESTHWRDGDERRPRWRRSLRKFPAYVDWTLPAEEFKWTEFHFTKWSSLLYCKKKYMHVFLTVLVKWNIILNKWLKVVAVVWHVRDDIEPVLEVITTMSLHLVAQGSEQAVPEIRPSIHLNSILSM